MQAHFYSLKCIPGTDWFLQHSCEVTFLSRVPSDLCYCPMIKINLLSSAPFRLIQAQSCISGSLSATVAMAAVTNGCFSRHRQPVGGRKCRCSRTCHPANCLFAISVSQEPGEDQLGLFLIHDVILWRCFLTYNKEQLYLVQKMFGKMKHWKAWVFDFILFFTF